MNLFFEFQDDAREEVQKLTSDSTAKIISSYTYCRN